MTSLKWLETNNLFNNLIQRNQSAAFSSGKVRPNHETNINIIARRTGKDVNSHTVLDGIITTIMATIQRINIIGSREGSKINPDTNKIPKHLFQGYLNIYNNYFKAPWMPDRTEANPNELIQDDARYGFRCCHLKNIWTAPLPPETELSRQMTTSTTSI